MANLDSRLLAEGSGDVPAVRTPPGGYRRIVAKVGTNVLTAGGDRLSLEVMASLVGQVARLHEQGVDVVVVSSGAIAAGRRELRIEGERRDIPFKQTLAAVGQSRLMHVYDQLFGWHGILVAQTLLTRADLADRQRYLNARNTLLALLDLRVVPVVNENDVVAVDEIRFGDNDNLSAMVAGLVDADLLVMLTDIAGLYDADPRVHPEARLLPRVERIDARIVALAGGAGSRRGTGGMLTKVQAARIAAAGGVGVAIASGQEPQVLLRLAQGENIGTFIPPAVSSLESRKRWLLAGLTGRARIRIDPGAARAVREQGRSLLPVGITGTEGKFERGDAVALVDPQGQTVACGIANYRAVDVRAIMGGRSDAIEQVLGYEYGAEVVHRNNLVVL